jgi:hypothetical protein
MQSIKLEIRQCDQSTRTRSFFCADTMLVQQMGTVQ